MLNNFIQNILDKIQGNGWSEGGVVYSKDIYERPIPFSKTLRRKQMQKAVLATEFQGVKDLNKLLAQGYTFQSVDERGVYILNEPEQKHEEKQPHVRIEFDDVLDVPKVWVDGKLLELDSKPLVHLSLDWNTDTAKEEHKAFEVEYLDLENHQRKSFSEGSFM